jgi:hypothetical protein
VQIEKGFELRRRAGRNVLAETGEFGARGYQCRVEAGLLFRDPRLGDVVMRDFELGV